jgi:8-oxo-dGTP pyrophosphatase MutT (NUDIX family)
LEELTVKKLVGDLSTNSVILIDGTSYYIIDGGTEGSLFPGCTVIQSIDGQRLRKITDTCLVDVVAEVQVTPHDRVREEFGRVVGCGVFVLRVVPEDDTVVPIIPARTELLVGNRADGQGWCVAGGKIEAIESYIDGAIRELHEELGLDVTEDNVGLIGSICTEGYINGVLTPVLSYAFLVTEYVGVPVFNPLEFTEIKWVNIETAETDVQLFTPTAIGLALYKTSLKYPSTAVIS